MLGPAMEIVDAFSAIAEKWLTRDDLPAVARIAFGVVLEHPEADRQAGYRRLPDYVPVKVDPESSDFHYQINLPPVPSATGIEGLSLNRLSKWGVAGRMSFRFTGMAVQAQPGTEAFALRLERDINTVADFAGRIPHARLVDIYRELVAAGRAIAANGVVTR